MLNYLVSIPVAAPAQKVVIHDPESKLKVKVLDAAKSKFTPKEGEKQFFVTAGKKMFAFETDGLKKHGELLILQMISWYCVYLGLIGAQIHATLP